MEALRALIGPDTGEAAWWQLCVRAAMLLVVGIVALRIAGRRTFSQYSPLDIVVAIIIGSNLSRAMTGKAPFLGGIAATLTVVVLHRALAMATLRWNLLARWVKCAPTVLVRDGVVDRQALARHGLSEEDLAEGLRLEQQAAPDNVALATLEGGGKISVVPKGP